MSLEEVQLNGQVQTDCEQLSDVPDVLESQTIGLGHRDPRSLTQRGLHPSQTQPHNQGRGQGICAVSKGSIEWLFSLKSQVGKH